MEPMWWKSVEWWEVVLVLLVASIVRAFVRDLFRCYLCKKWKVRLYREHEWENNMRVCWGCGAVYTYPDKKVHEFVDPKTLK